MLKADGYAGLTIAKVAARGRREQGADRLPLRLQAGPGGGRRAPGRRAITAEVVAGIGRADTIDGVVRGAIDGVWTRDGPRRPHRPRLLRPDRRLGGRAERAPGDAGGPRRLAPDPGDDAAGGRPHDGRRGRPHRGAVRPHRRRGPGPGAGRGRRQRRAAARPRALPALRRARAGSLRCRHTGGDGDRDRCELVEARPSTPSPRAASRRCSSTSTPSSRWRRLPRDRGRARRSTAATTASAAGSTPSTR